MAPSLAAYHTFTDETRWYPLFISSSNNSTRRTTRTPSTPYGTYYCNRCNKTLFTYRLPVHYACYMKTYLNASEIAKLLKVDRATVSRWIKKGLLKGAVRLDSTQQWRIPIEAYENFIKSSKHESH